MLSLSAVPTSPFFLHGCNPTPKFPRFTKYAYGRFECVESRRCSDTSNKVRWTKPISYTVWGPPALSTGPQQTSRGRISVKERLKGRGRASDVGGEWGWRVNSIQAKRSSFWGSHRKLKHYLGTSSNVVTRQCLLVWLLTPFLFLQILSKLVQLVCQSWWL